MYEIEISHLIRLISIRMRSQGDAALKRQGLTLPQLQVLINLEKNGGSMSQKQLQDKIGVTHPTIVGIVSRLEKGGYVETAIDRNDRRNKIVIASAKAKDIGAVMKKGHSRFSNDVFGCLSEEKQKEMYEMLQTVSDRLDELQKGTGL